MEPLIILWIVGIFITNAIYQTRTEKRLRELEYKITRLGEDIHNEVCNALYSNEHRWNDKTGVIKYRIEG